MVNVYFESHLTVCCHFPIILTLFSMCHEPQFVVKTYLRAFAEDFSASKMAALGPSHPPSFLTRESQRSEGKKGPNLKVHFPT